MHSESGRNPMVSSEQKLITSRKDLVLTVSKPWQLVLDFFVRTILAARAFLTVEEPRRFSWRENYLQCLEKSTQSLVEAYTPHLVDQISDGTSDEQLTEAVRVYL